jgi:hypothetical protein
VNVEFASGPGGKPRAAAAVEGGDGGIDDFEIHATGDLVCSFRVGRELRRVRRVGGG